MDDKIKENEEIEHKDELVEVVASFLGILPEQVKELKERLMVVRFDKDGGFGLVQVEYRSRKIYRMSHKINGRPHVFGKDGE